jgi:hypothetical protein
MGSYALPMPKFIKPYRATDRAPVAQLPMYVKIEASFHLPTHRDMKRHGNYYLVRHHIFPRWVHLLNSKPLKG